MLQTGLRLLVIDDVAPALELANRKTFGEVIVIDAATPGGRQNPEPAAFIAPRVLLP